MTYELINTSAHDTGLPDESVDAIITSPPYFSLRAYEGDQNVDWPAVFYSPMPGLPPLRIPAMTCELGLEPTPEAYIGHLVLVMREMWRVLKNTGTAWVNLGDSYAQSEIRMRNGQGSSSFGLGPYEKSTAQTGRKSNHSIKPKNLILIPERFRLACQADGWYVRAAVPWVKYNGMPDSCTDRPTITHEDWVLLAKSERYFFDMEAVKVESASTHSSGNGFKRNARLSYQNEDGTPRGSDEQWEPTPKRFWRTSDMYRASINEAIAQLRHAVKHGGVVGTDQPVGIIANTKPYSQAHFATFPPTLIEPLIKCSTSERGNCPKCGAPWQRVVEKVGNYKDDPNYRPHESQSWTVGSSGTHSGHSGNMPTVERKFHGWQPTCDCDAELTPVPAVVLDPFVGSGTTVQAAIKLGRRAIGIDISAKYLEELVPERVSNTQLVML